MLLFHWLYIFPNHRYLALFLLFYLLLFLFQLSPNLCLDNILSNLWFLGLKPNSHWNLSTYRFLIDRLIACQKMHSEENLL